MRDPPGYSHHITDRSGYLPVVIVPVKNTPDIVTGCTGGIIGDMSSDATGASIVVPAYREAPNIQPLVERIFAAVKPTGRPVELIVVDDDSQDGTEDAINRLRGEHPVRLIVRRGERGLSSAVIAGFREAKYDLLVVLDADLQHPPEAIPAMLDRLEAEGCDFVIASRYVGEASIADNWPLRRRAASLLARWLARPIAPLTDPLSGFFALRRSTWKDASDVNPIGYKIALELYVKGRCRQPAEVPIRFAARTAGQSKFSFAEQVRYLRHLSRLYRFRFPWLPGAIVSFALVAFVLLILLILRAAA